MINDKPYFGLTIIESDTLPPGRAALVDFVGILKCCPRDAQGRIIVTPAACEGRIIYLSIDPKPETSEQSDASA